jgi:hypothetical protein
MRHPCRYWVTCPHQCNNGRPYPPSAPKAKKELNPHKVVVVSSITRPSYNCSRYETKLSLVRIHRGFQEFKGQDGKKHNCVRVVHGRLRVCRNLVGSSVQLINPITASRDQASLKL